ncbi:MAG: hypothetical protein PVF58_06405 [Candidatus Methanofastidiosia archaeon]
MDKKYTYIVMLLLLSPCIAELFSGSSPFFTFFTPGVLLVYIGFYGLGALIIREIGAHKHLQYSSIILLGAAFGCWEEGVLLKSWFDPLWMGAQITSQALRVHGVSVLQPFANVVYHAVVSITAPLVLVESVSSREPWLSKKELVACGILFGLSSILLSKFNDYAISGWQYVLGIGLFVIFIVLGLKGVKIFASGEKMICPYRLWGLSALFVVLLFIIFYTLSSAGISWVIILLAALILYGWYAKKYSGIHFDAGHYFAAAAGVPTGLLVISGIMARTAPEKGLNFVVALLFVLILVVYYVKTFKKT